MSVVAGMAVMAAMFEAEIDGACGPTISQIGRSAGS
jgi:hypothetical protein